MDEIAGPRVEAGGARCWGVGAGQDRGPSTSPCTSATSQLAVEADEGVEIVAPQRARKSSGAPKVVMAQHGKGSAPVAARTASGRPTGWSPAGPSAVARSAITPPRDPSSVRCSASMPANPLGQCRVAARGGDGAHLGRDRHALAGAGQVQHRPARAPRRRHADRSGRQPGGLKSRWSWAPMTSVFGPSVGRESPPVGGGDARVAHQHRQVGAAGGIRPKASAVEGHGVEQRQRVARRLAVDETGCRCRPPEARGRAHPSPSRVEIGARNRPVRRSIRLPITCAPAAVASATACPHVVEDRGLVVAEVQHHRQLAAERAAGPQRSAAPPDRVAATLPRLETDRR